MAFKNDKPLSASLKTTYRHLKFFARKLFSQELTYYASSLSFYTIFTLIPILIVILTLFANLPLFSYQVERLEDFIFASFIPIYATSIQEHMHTFIKNSINLSLLGGVSILVASILFFLDYEYIVNQIFKSKSRGFFHGIFTYVTLLILVPAVLTLSIYLSYQIALFFNAYNVDIMTYPLKFLPYFLIWALFFTLYKVSANTQITTKAALISSFVIAIIWNSVKYGFVYYALLNQTYSTLYGSFSILLFFFLWIYISWIVIIYGLRLCYLIDRIYKYRQGIR